MHGRQEARQTLLLLNQFSSHAAVPELSDARQLSCSGSLEGRSVHDQLHVNDLRETSTALTPETEEYRHDSAFLMQQEHTVED
jgi:hypothetical protein